MATTPLYDQVVAQHYDRDEYGIFELARRSSLSQLKAIPTAKPVVLDIGCGTGLLLQALQQQTDLGISIGLDPSQAMLAMARTRGISRTVCADLAEAEAHIAPASIDLACLHFVLAYVAPSAALAVIARLLKPGGRLSLVTSTLESMATMARLGAHLLSAEELRRKVNTPADAESLTRLLEEHGFRLLELAPLRRELLFNDMEQVYDFCINQGWLLPLCEQFEWLRAHPESMQTVFPFHDEFRGLALLAERI